MRPEQDFLRKRSGQQRAPASVPLIACLLTYAFAPSQASAGIDDIFEAVKQSEFRFARGDSEVPFFPVGWLQDSHYPAATFTDGTGAHPEAKVTENTLSAGGIVPVYVARRDMFVLGADLDWDHINVNTGPYQDQRIARVTPVAAWLRQLNERDIVGAFVAPIFSKETYVGQSWAINGYGGIVGMHWQNDQVQWLYGGIYEYSFGRHSLYPYLGMQWLPTPKLAMAVVLPWPTVTYAVNPDWLLQLAVVPGGSSWIKRGGSYESTQTFGSWNLTANGAYRLYGSIWLSAGAGIAGFRGLTITSGAGESRFESERSPVYTLALQFRPQSGAH